ncbi:hypothetical protein PSPO_b0247 [Pseudoalteromonas spongiae UST010723-006]|nr:hypothetical protein PSPO_b0247 [Pseudoalteromonas spongiae UST010723-006]
MPMPIAPFGLLIVSLANADVAPKDSATTAAIEVYFNI